MAYLHSYRAILSFLAQTFLIAAVVRHPRFTEEATARWAIILGMALKYAEVRVCVGWVSLYGWMACKAGDYTDWSNWYRPVLSPTLP